MLKHRAASATLWSGADVLLRQGLQFAVSIVLARLLAPADFGTVALLSLFTGLATTLVDGGFSVTLLRNQDATHLDESTVFWLNVAVGTAAALALWAAGPAIAAWFAVPVLAPLCTVFGANIVVSALGSLQATLLSKQLDFRAQMRVGAVSSLAGAALAVAMALRGAGVWALAVPVLATSLVSTAMLWMVSPWRPAARASLDSLRRMFGFGAWFFAAGLLDMGYQRLYTLLVGKTHGTAALGFYARADGTRQLPTGILHSVVARVAFPVFAAAAAGGDRAQMVRGMRLALRGLVLVNVPAMLGIAVIAAPLVEFLFGARWLPAAPILQVLCLAGLFWPVHMVNLYVLAAQGHARLYFLLELAKKALGLALLLAGWRHGLLGIAWSQVAYAAVCFVADARCTRHFLGYGLLAQSRDILPMALFSAPLLAAAWFAGAQLDGAAWTRVLVPIVVGGFIFAVQAWALRRSLLADVIGFGLHGLRGAATG